MLGHVCGGAVRAACYSPCGTFVALTRADTEVHVMNSTTEDVKFILKDMHKKSIISLAFSPDGKLLAQGSKDNSATVTDLETGKLLCSVAEHDGAALHNAQICAVGFSADSSLLLLGSADGAASLVDARSGELRHKLEGTHERWIRAVDFSPDGQWAMLGCDDNTASVWNVDTGKIQCQVGKHKKGIMAVRFTQDRSGCDRLFLGSADKTVSVYDASQLASGKCEELFRADCKHTDGNIWSMNFSADGRRVVLGSSDSVVSVVDVRTGKKLLTLQGIHADGITAASFSPNGHRIVTGSGDAAKTASVHHLPVCLQPLATPD